MKKFYVLFACMLLTAVAVAQDARLTNGQGITICHTPATEKFALFASNKKFNADHQAPRKYVHRSMEGGKMITLKCPDGSMANAYLIEAKKKTNNWIFVFQEWWGLNDNIKRQSEDIFKDLGNVNVIALDMYDGKLATTKEDAGKFMGEFKIERGMQIISGAQNFAGKDARIGTVGWCFGGGLSLQAALALGKQSAACVIYYGMPEGDVERLKTLNSDVLGIFGTKDGWINGDVVKKLEADMKAAGKNLVVKNYDADHAFANPSNPLGTFEEKAYKDSYKQTVEFFKARLK
jgi:carboxymethylenebutenolidase